MSNTYQALNIPPAANERGGFEILRCAIVEGELHLTLRPVFNEPNDWGRLFAEVAREHKAGLVPFLLKGVADGPDAAALFQADRIHPREEAQAAMLDNVWAELRRQLR